MSVEKDELPTAVSAEMGIQTHQPSLHSELVESLQNIEPMLVSEDEYGLPIPSVEEHKELESPRPSKNENKQQQRQKEQKKTRKKRHGARNQHRHKFFVKWLISKFDLDQSKCTPPNSSTTTIHHSDSNSQIGAGDDRNSKDEGSCVKNNAEVDSHDHDAKHSQGSTTYTASISSRYQELHILDVAGGKGEVSARLTMCHLQRVVMVDPRRADIVDCFERIVLPKIPNKWQRRLEDQREKNPDFVRNVVGSRFKQLVTTFDDHKIAFDINEDIDWSSLPQRFGTRSEIAELQAAIQHATLIVGLHADGATEAIVDAALKYHKPFVVVPCCVFPSFFPMRRLVVDEKDGTPPQSIPVRTHEQFCKFLLQKDPRFVMEELPFEGRNIAIWWDGK